jgi:Zn-dependent peptidase ImmA (M78 family)/transcriptional regulator with XRE-family HTH domain
MDQSPPHSNSKIGMEPSMATQKVDVQPDVLTWARESIGLSREDAAKKLNMSPTDLRFLEEGVGDVSLPRLRIMSRLYDRPLIAFFLPHPPADEDDLPDFRMTPESHGQPWSTKMHEAYRRVVAQREVALELAELDEEPIPRIGFELRMEDDPEEAGEGVRGWLAPKELPSSTRASAPYQFFNAWVSLVEARAVLVTQVTGIAIEEMRGFSIGEHPLPVIAINSGDFIRGRTFTLMHELAHVLLRRSSLCDLEDVASAAPPPFERLEWFCNAVAAAVLMPRNALLGEPIVRDATDDTQWSDDDLLYLSAHFGVSAESMLLRLVTLHRASRDFYRQRRPHFLRVYRDQFEQSGGGGGDYYSNHIARLGRRYITTVLAAYNRDDITDADLSRYLNMKLKNVPTLMEKMGTDQ